MGNMTELKKMFSTANFANPAQEGVATRLRRLSDALIGTEGAVTTKTEGLSSSLNLNKKRQDEFTARLALTEARLRKQYSNLDTQMAGLSALNTYVSQQVTSWNKST
jgi:flagellar hook-associated protein 2